MQRRPSCFVPLVLVLGAAFAGPVPAQLVTIEDPTPATTGFGGPSALIGDWIIVSEADPFFTGQPDATHQFDAGTGAFVRTLAADVPSAIVAYGDDILLGFRGEVVRLYDGQTGAVLQTFVLPVPSLDKDVSVAVAGADVLVGSPAAGAVYRFDPTTGHVLQTWVDPVDDLEFMRGFGASLAVTPTRLVVGDRGEDAAARNAVYVFDLASGALLRSIPNPTPAAGYRMGASLIVRDGVIWAGASGELPKAPGSIDKDIGVTYRFDLETGALLQTIRNPSPAAGRGYGAVGPGRFGPDRFGHPVLEVGGRVTIGALQQQNFNAYVQRGGVVYTYDDDGGVVEAVRAAGIVPGFDPDATWWWLTGMVSSDARLMVLRGRNAESSVFDVIGPCGNGIVDPGEQCDDGNLLDGDCCTSTCALHAPVACIPAAPGASSLALKRTPGQQKDQLAFTWIGGAPLAPADLGTPDAGTDYAVCIVEDVAGTPTLRLSSMVPATGPCPQPDGCWKTFPDSLRYKAKGTDPDGIKSVTVKAGGAPRAVVKGQGPLLGSRPMPVAGSLTVRLQRRDAPVCFEATFGSNVQVDTATTYRARGD